MKKKPGYAIFSAALALTLAGLACNGGAAAPTKAPPTQAPAATQIVAKPSATPHSVEPTATEKAATAATETAIVAPTAAATAAATQAALSGKLDVHGIASYLDGLKYYHLDGLITNGTDQPVSNVQLSLTLTDKSGKTVLKDDSGKPTSTVTFSNGTYPPAN